MRALFVRPIAAALFVTLFAVGSRVESAPAGIVAGVPSSSAGIRLLDPSGPWQDLTATVTRRYDTRRHFWQIVFTVKNVGHVDAPQVLVRFAAAPVRFGIFAVKVPAGQERAVYVDAIDHWGQPIPVKYAYAFVDYTNAFAEDDEENNLVKAYF
jgi:hypothetical protein